MKWSVGKSLMSGFFSETCTGPRKSGKDEAPENSNCGECLLMKIGNRTELPLEDNVPAED